ncbi:alpha/beta hydrolase [Euzebya pacifica]|jgi:pimeloyl-ACP methyl ester carboxylesterase|uniref:alpha/beta fold hydrolase n=1 Tax=Euzebya pacifica TaxID=1608957 RepID=UPI0030FA474F
MTDVQRWRQQGHDRLLAGRRIFTVDRPAQEEEDGPPLLLVHGFPTCGADWRHVLPLLGRRRRVLVVDLLGYGLSEKPDLPYSLDVQADVLEAFVDDVGLSGQPIVLITHDMGDSVGGELLARILEGRSSVVVDRRVLTNGSIFIEDADLRVGQKLLLAVGDRAVPLPAVQAMFRRGLPEVFGPCTQPSEEEMDLQWALLSHDGGQRLYPRLIRYLPERRRRQDRWTGAITAHASPLTVVWGALDPVAGLGMAVRLKQQRPDLELVVLDDVGHFPMIEAPEAFADVVLSALT